MRGKVKEFPQGFQLVLKAKDDKERAWLENAFNSIRVGCLSREEGVTKELILWTDCTPEYYQSLSEQNTKGEKQQ